MANTFPRATTWVGNTDDATLGSNWTFGVPNQDLVDVFIGATPSTSLVGFGAKSARGTMNASTNFIEDDTVILDAKTYTYKDAPSADGEVDVGTDLETSLDNLFDAINLVAGGAYGASMTIHPTVEAEINLSTSLTVKAKDAGTVGNSIVSDVGGGNTGDGTWSAGTLGGGAATGALMENVYTDAAWPGNINSSGSEAQIEFNKFFHRGSGTIYLKVAAGQRLIIDSANAALAAQIVVVAGLVSVEVVAGGATLDQNGVTNSAQRIVVSESTANPSRLTVTGTGTVGRVRTTGGTLVWNGPTTSDMASGGFTRFISGTITLLSNTGTFEFEATTTLVEVEHYRGIFDMTTTAAAKTVTTLVQYPGAELIRRTDFDTITVLERIGVD